MTAGSNDHADWTAVEAHLSRLDSSDLAALVADLWSGRGYDVDRAGTTVTTTRGKETVVVAVCGGRSERDEPGESADVVVDTRSKSCEGKTVFDAGDLAEQLRYAVEPAVARTICERHLGGPPDQLSVPLGVRARRAVPDVVTVALVVVAATVLAAAAFGAVGGFVGNGETGEDPLAVDSGIQSTPDATPTDDGGDPPRWMVDDEQLPPGISESGVTDLQALEQAHESAISNQSYTVRIDRYRAEIREREIADVTREVMVRVEGEEYIAESAEVVEGDRTELATLYHDGSDTYLATAGENATYRRVTSTALLDDFPRSPGNITDRVVRSKLSVSTTALVGVRERNGERLYRITGQSETEELANSSVTAYNVSALVTTEGFVRELTTENSYVSGYNLVDTRRELVYDRVGTTTVDPPEWYREQFAGEQTD